MCRLHQLHFGSRHVTGSHQHAHLPHMASGIHAGCCWWVLQVFVLAGPCGAGRTTLAHQLLQDFGDKLVPVPLLTNR